MLITAIYVGASGKNGFKSNVTYKILIYSNNPEKIECMSDNNKGAIVKYPNIIEFLKNWKVVEILASR